MSSYRQHGYDPNAYEQAGAPMRPFNWLQWTGVAIGAVGFVLTMVHLLGSIGWMRQWFEGSPPFFVLMLLGLVLVNSRREPGTLAGSEQLARNRRVLLITVAVCAAILGAALVIDRLGA